VAWRGVAWRGMSWRGVAWRVRQTDRLGLADIGRTSPAGGPAKYRAGAAQDAGGPQGPPAALRRAASTGRAPHYHDVTRMIMTQYIYMEYTRYIPSMYLVGELGVPDVCCRTAAAWVQVSPSPPRAASQDAAWAAGQIQLISGRPRPSWDAARRASSWGNPSCYPSGMLTTWTRNGKTEHTCLNMAQTCMYMFTKLHTRMNMYVYVMYMYIHLYKCTYMFMHSYLCMCIVHILA
jgi:hypothetical protein